MNFKTILAAPLTALSEFLLRTAAPSTTIGALRAKVNNVVNEINVVADNAETRANALYEAAAGIATIGGNNQRLALSARELAGKMKNAQ